MRTDQSVGRSRRPRAGADQTRGQRVTLGSITPSEWRVVSDPPVKWADISGDGLQDVVQVYDRDVEYWP